MRTPSRAAPTTGKSVGEGARSGLNWFQMLWHDDAEKAACSSVITSLNLGIRQALMVSV